MPSPTIRQVHVDQPLTDLSIALFQEKPPVSDLLFPRVPVVHQSDLYYIWDKADLWRDDAALRSPGSAFERITMRESTDSFRCKQHALEYLVPDENVANADAQLRLKQTGTRVLTSRLNTRKDTAFAKAFFKPGVWANNLAGVASAPNASQVLRWDVAGSNPAANVQAMVEAILSALGDADDIRLVGLMGSPVRSVLRNHADAIDRIKYTKAATPAAIDSTMADWLGLDQVLVPRRRVTTSQEGAAVTTSDYVFGKGMLIVAVANAPALETISAGYSFAWDEGGKGDMYIQDYRSEEVMSDVVRGVTHFDQKLVASDLGGFFAGIVG